MVMTCTSMLIFSACGDKEIVPREVELTLINPITGEVVKEGDRLDLPTEKTYVEVRIKDKETGKYLTDEDLPDNTIKGSYKVEFEACWDDWTDGGAVYTYNYWPQDVDALRDHYKISIFFESMPRGLNDSKFQRKFKSTAQYLRVYFNR